MYSLCLGHISPVLDIISTLFLRLLDFRLTSSSLILHLVTDRKQSGRKFRGDGEKGALYCRVWLKSLQLRVGNSSTINKTCCEASLHGGNIHFGAIPNEKVN